MKTLHLDLIICSLENLFYPFLTTSTLKVDPGFQVQGIYEFQINFKKNISSSKQCGGQWQTSPYLGQVATSEGDLLDMISSEKERSGPWTSQSLWPWLSAPQRPTQSLPPLNTEVLMDFLYRQQPPRGLQKPDVLSQKYRKLNTPLSCHHKKHVPQ